MTDIVITEFMDEDVVRSVFAGRDVLYDATLVDQPERLSRELADARALIVRNRTQVRGALLAGAPKLRVVGRLGVGLDNIDVDACTARGIAVHPATGANTSAVAEYVITAALVLLRRAWFATREVTAGSWPRTRCIGRELSGKSLGLVGFGAIAREAARRALALGVRVRAFDPYLSAADPAWSGIERISFETLLAESDIVSLHVPLTPETRHLIDARAIDRMKRDAILINAARGGVVDENALLAALRKQRLGGAALDVFECEPVDASGGQRFADIQNLILTPHIAGVTFESNVRVSDATARAVLVHLT